MLHTGIAQEKTVLSKGGIIIHNTDIEAIVVKDSILVTMVYNLNDLEYMWNVYIESGESLIAIIGKNSCINKVLSDSRESRFKIKQFIDKTRGKDKRQVMGIIGSITSMVGHIRFNTV